MGYWATSVAQVLSVTDAQTAQALPGATIGLRFSEGWKYFAADKQGNFKLPSKAWSEQSFVPLKVSFIGYKNLKDTLRNPNENRTFSLSPSTFNMNEVVVTAQYGESSTEKSVHKVRVISSEKIEQMAAVNLRDVLTNELNVRLSQDNILGSGMSLQGVSGQNVKILVDGVPIVGRLDGQIDLSQLNLTDVERIEIVEGPMSVNFGSNALAGTINIITKKNLAKKWSVGVNSYTENIGTYNLSAFLAKRIGDRHQLRISAGRNFFDGWSPDDDFIPSFEAALADSSRVDQWNPKEQVFGRLQYFYKLQQIRLGYKLEFLDESITNRGFPRRGVRTISAFDDYYHTNRLDNSLSAEGKLNDKLNLNFIAAYNDFERIKESRRKDLTTLASELVPETAGNDLQDTSTFSLWMSRASISSSMDSSWLNYEIGYDLNYERASGARIDNQEQALGDYAMFGSLQITSGNLVLKPAIRYAYNTKYDAPLTPAFNLKYKLLNQVTIRASYARGFRAPSLKELYFNFDDVNHSLFGNPELKAEESNNYTISIGRKHLFKKFLLEGEFSAFYNDIRNQINFANINQFGGGDTLVYLNIGEFQTKGLNARASLASERVKLNLGYSYTGRYNRLAEENPIQDFSYTAEWMANVTYTFKDPELQLALFFKHQGELPGFGYNAEDELVEQSIAAFQMLDLSINKAFWKKKLHATLGCKNVLDVQNVQANLASGGAHTSASNSISVGTGRTVFIRLRLKFTHP